MPENDSHGELIYSIAEYGRYTGDSTFAELMWPHVQGAYTYMEQLRASERTEEPCAQSGVLRDDAGLDQPRRLFGQADAFVLGQFLGPARLQGRGNAGGPAGQVEAMQIAESRDQFRDDLQASLLSAMQQHNIDYLPGSAELGDFDATSTTIALAPGGEQGRLPQQALEATFERYWKNS